MKKNILIISALLVLIGFSCKKAPLTNGETITETRKLSSFNAVYLYNNIDVYLIQSDTFKIEITTGDNLMGNIISDVIDNTLYLKNENILNWIRSYDYPLKAKIYHNGNIKNITYESVGDLVSEGYTFNDTTASFKLSLLDGSGNIDLKLNSKHTDFFCGGDCTSDIKLRGSSCSAYINHNGLGPLDAEDMEVNNMDLHSYSYNDIYVNCNNILNAYINEMGNIYYKGHPDITLKVSPNAQGKLISIE